jgi:hypothetical protein
MLKNLNFFIDTLIDFSIILWNKEDFFELFLIGVIAIVGVIIVEELLVEESPSNKGKGKSKTTQAPKDKASVKPSAESDSKSKGKK